LVLSLTVLALSTQGLSAATNPCVISGTSTATVTHNGSVKTTTAVSQNSCGGKAASCQAASPLGQAEVDVLILTPGVGQSQVTGTVSCGKGGSPSSGSCTAVTVTMPSCGDFLNYLNSPASPMSCGFSVQIAAPASTAVGSTNSVVWTVSCGSPTA